MRSLVITTATDVNRLPAIDMVAVQNNLSIENPDAIKTVNMALLTGDPIALSGYLGSSDVFDKAVVRLLELKESIRIRRPGSV